MKRFNWQNWAWSLLAAWTLGTQTGWAEAPSNWFTFLGGNRDDVGTAIAIDPNTSAIYVAGSTFSSNWISGGFSTNYTGSRDAFVAKLTPDGSSTIWSTYIGASSDDQAAGLVLGTDGSLFVMGNTRSRGWVIGGFDTTYNDNGKQDVFVTKISTDGVHQWSTFLGGNDFEVGRAIAMDAEGNLLVTGSTLSAGWVRGGALTNYQGNQDAFVAKLSPTNGATIWATYLGGKDLDAGRAIAVDTNGYILVTGETTSKGWVRGVPGTSFFGTNYNDKQDAFVAKLSATNGSTIWSSYLGGKDADQGTGIAVDSANNILVCGFTTSSNWISGGASTNFLGSQDAFLAKLAPNGTPVWSTYLGGRSVDYAAALAVNSANDVFLTGHTYSLDWVNGGSDLFLDGMQDAFVAKLSSSNGSTLWSTYLGGESAEAGAAIALHNRAVFVAGLSTSTNWTNLVTPPGTTNHGGADVLVAMLSEPGASVCSTLSAPTLTSSCGTSNAPVLNRAWNPTFAWSAVPNATDYAVFVFMARSNLLFPVYVSSLIQPTTNFFTLPNYVLYDRQLYAWSVQAVGDGTSFCNSELAPLCWFTNNITDNSRPSVNITAPSSDARFINTTVTNITVTGTASDNVGVARVRVMIRYGVPTTVSTPTNEQTWVLALGTNNWTADVTLAPGTNTVFAYSEDAAGNISPVANRTFYYVVTNMLTLVTNGSGTISRDGFTTNRLEVGRGYSVTANPKSDNLFLNWTVSSDSGTFTTNIAKLRFAMETNMTLTANFITNRFRALKGIYNGLIFPTNHGLTFPTNAGMNNSGYFTLDLTDRGSFSGKLSIDGETLPFSGAFNAGLDPVWLWVIWSPVTPAHFGSEPLTVKLVLDPLNQTIDGSVHYNTWWGWESALQSHRAVSTNAFAGSYTMWIDGSTNAAASPAGYGAANVTIDARANVTVTGTLADGTPITQNTTISAYPDGSVLWPFYASLYSSKGVITGWMGTNASTLPIWVKQPVTNDRYYSNGFSMVSATLVARYVAPKGNTNALNWTSGQAIIGGGNLAEPLTNSIVLSNNQVRVTGGSISNLALTISAQSGSFSGSFLAPSARTKTNVKGVLDQFNNVGAGWFLGTNQSGFILLQAAP